MMHDAPAAATVFFPPPRFAPTPTLFPVWLADSFLVWLADSRLAG